MNKVVLMGRLTRDPEVKRKTQGDKESIVARWSIAVNRRFKREGDAEADFFNCVAFGKAAEFIEKYFRQGMKIAVTGRLQSGSYTNKDGVKIYTVDVIVEEMDFCESKEASAKYGVSGSEQENRPAPQDVGDGFMTIPDGLDEELPFA